VFVCRNSADHEIKSDPADVGVTLAQREDAVVGDVGRGRRGQREEGAVLATLLAARQCNYKQRKIKADPSSFPNIETHFNIFELYKMMKTLNQRKNYFF
jgi:hypothetical protein